MRKQLNARVKYTERSEINDAINAIKAEIDKQLDLWDSVYLPRIRELGWFQDDV